MGWKWGVGGGHWIPLFSIYYNVVKLFCSSPFRTSTVSYPPNFPVISGPLQYCCLLWREKTRTLRTCLKSSWVHFDFTAQNTHKITKRSPLKVFLQLKWGFISSFHKSLRNSIKYEWRCDNLAWQFYTTPFCFSWIYFWDNLKVITTWPV